MEIPELLWHPDTLQQGLSLLSINMGTTGCTQTNFSRWDVIKNPNEWLHEQCDQINITSQRVDLPLGELKRKIAELGPCLIKMTDEANPGYLIVAATSRRGLKVLNPNGSFDSVTANQFIDGFINWLRQKTHGNVDRVIERFEQSAGKLSVELQRKLFVSLMSAYHINQIWTFSRKEHRSLLTELTSRGAWQHLTGFVFGLLLTQLFFVLSWFVLGSSVLSGRSGTDWLLIWVMLLFGYLVARLYSREMQMKLSLLVSVIIKRRMLIGMTNMPLEAVKLDGPCHLLTRCYESGQFEAASVGLVLGSLSGFVSLIVALGTLISLELWGLLVVFILLSSVALSIMWKLYVTEALWTQSRISLTHSLAELMIGQRTRKIQQAIHLRHNAEDIKLNRYIELQRKKDKLQIIYTMLPSGWNVFGLGVILFDFATYNNIVNIPASAGVWLLVSISITQLSSVYLQVIRLCVAWITIAPLLNRQHHRKEHKTTFALSNNDTDRLLEIRDVSYQYPGRKIKVLDGCTLKLKSKDKIILEGKSGSGKSTLISLLTGMRPVTRGSILLSGIEQNMISKAQWGEKVVMVPQYHENYLFTETLAFNLLLGTEWPAELAQLEKARMICHELGLSNLLKKMPSELMQVVGEMGWTLSHGEKSRIFVARAILQQPDLIILDESLASLDPDNTHRVLACVEKHCKAVIIVAHP